MSEGGTIGNDIRWNGSGTPNLERAIKVTGETAEILAKKAGISKTNMYNLLAVYRNRPDLFERVFNGEISINKAYTQMKADDSCTRRNRGMTEKGALVSFNRAPTSLTFRFVRHPQSSVFR